MYKEDFDRNRRPRFERRDRFDRFDRNDRNDRFERRDRSESREREADDIHSIPVKAGKRTYFFDVKSTRGNNDFYLTITESKRHTNADGSFTYDKHKIFLYKEDFMKFAEGLNDAIEYIKNNCFDGEIPQREEHEDHEEHEESVL